jgi:hypothetical protein
MKANISESRDRGFRIKTKGYGHDENSRKEEWLNENTKPGEKRVADPLARALIDASAKFTNDLQTQEAHRRHDKSQTDLLQKLTIFQAAGSSEGKFSVKRQYPAEVIIQSHDSDCEPGASTVFSELAVEGLLSVATEERRFPKRFTFDVVPSRSSLDESEPSFGPNRAVQPSHIQFLTGVTDVVHALGCETNDLTEPSSQPNKKGRKFEEFDPIMAVRSGTLEEMTGAPLMLDGLQYEIDDLSEPSHPDNMDLEGCDRNRERCRTESTEMSIELSESQFLGSQSANVYSKYAIFSPQNRITADEVDHGFDVVQPPDAQSKQIAEASSPWLNFAFLSIW